MSAQSLLKAILAFNFWLTVWCSQDTSIEVTYSSACEVCSCGPGPSLQPKELVKCQNPQAQLTIISLPDFARGIEISNASKGVVFNRGAIRVRETFRVSVQEASTVDFREKSTTIIDTKGSVSFNLQKISHLQIRSRAVSSSSGSFELQVYDSKVVDIEGQAFDVINKVHLNKIQRLNLDPAAFKPNVQLLMQQPFAELVLEQIDSIPILPMEVFSSARSILFSHCQIDEIESTAFSGVSVFNITFDSSKIDRIHTSTFTDRAIVQNLAFVNCTLTSISDKAVSSGISILTILSSNFSSVNSEAFDTSVAKVNISNCIFKTLVENSFSFRSWSEITFSRNTFSFLDQNAFLLITEPNTPSVFDFAGNTVQFANRNALKLEVGSEASKKVTESNNFHKDCECDLDKWLMAISGETDFKNPSEWSITLLNNSLCQVPFFAKGCFGQDQVLLRHYSDKMCTMMASNEDCSYESPWNLIRDQITVDTNKGILLLLLMFVLASTLVVGILTLVRWIIYTIQARQFHKKHAQDWSFTKIEEQQQLKENIEEEAIELEESPSTMQSASSQSPQHYESLGMNCDKDKQDEKEPLLEAKLPEHASEGKPPNQTTFYDEMICLLQEKLEDPENYSTVVDDKENATTLYMDPLSTRKS